VPRQNRVTPFGEIVAVPERGTVMGNRGVLHDADGRIRRAWQVKRWIICVLEFRGRHRQVMAPDRYTELFFLDEATALAAGHRPCFECRRKSFNAYADAWASGNLVSPGEGRPAADSIDDRLHAERVNTGGTKRTHAANLADLPDDVMVTLPGASGAAYLVLGDSLLAWSPGGYAGRLARPVRGQVSVLTPESTVAAIRAGYQPGVHPSASMV
jgi:hypothetical protein